LSCVDEINARKNKFNSLIWWTKQREKKNKWCECASESKTSPHIYSMIK